MAELEKALTLCTYEVLAVEIQNQQLAKRLCWCLKFKPLAEGCWRAAAYSMTLKELAGCAEPEGCSERLCASK